MKHPEIPAWSDYARGITDSGDRAALQTHLDDGCERCRATVSALERLVATAEIDVAVTPPAGVIRSVKAFFNLQHPKSHRFWSELQMRTAFDSDLAPAPAASVGRPITSGSCFSNRTSTRSN